MIKSFCDICEKELQRTRGRVNKSKWDFNISLSDISYDDSADDSIGITGTQDVCTPCQTHIKNAINKIISKIIKGEQL